MRNRKMQCAHPLARETIPKLDILDDINDIEVQPTSGRGSIPLPRMESLTIYDCENLVEVFNAPPSLKKMDIGSCPKLESIVGKQRRGSALVEGPCSDNVASSAVSGPSSPAGDHFSPSETLESHSGELPSLVQLRLSSSLRWLEITGCPAIKVLPTSLQQRLGSLDLEWKYLDARHEGPLEPAAETALEQVGWPPELRRCRLHCR
uniref:Uncharacterized protein n=1 Tax=Oryza punctata TaxID=4537 RepID=A0A0E0JIC8_ORYPU